MGNINETIIKNKNIQKNKLNILSKEYELSINEYGKTERQFLAIGGAGLGILSYLSGVTLENLLDPQKLDNNLWITNVIPLVVTLFIAILLQQYYQLEARLRRCKIISYQINHLFPQPILSRFLSIKGHGNFTSLRHGNIKYRMAIWIISIIIIFLYCFVICSCMYVVISVNRIFGISYLVILLTINIVIVFSFFGIFTDLPKYYDQLQDKLINPEYVNSDKNLNTQDKEKRWNNVYGILLPRRKDFFQKAIYFWIGFFAAFLLNYEQPFQHKMESELSRARVIFIGFLSNQWMFLLIGVIYFLIEEFFLQQAKLLWDDIRDVERDSKSIQNKDRAYTKKDIGEKTAKLHVCFRWSFALLLGYYYGGSSLLIVLLLISFHQIIYVLWLKPISGKHPLLILSWLSFSNSLRVVTGVLAITEITVFYFPLLILLLVFYFNMFGFMAAYWKMEAIYLRNNSREQIRPQSYYYENDTNKHQREGFIAAVLSSSILLLVLLNFNQLCRLPLSRSVNLIFECNNGHASYREIFAGYSLILLIIGALLIYLLSKLGYRIILYILKPFQRIMNTICKGVTFFSLIFFIYYLAISIISLNFFFFCLSIFLLHTYLLGIYDSMSYEDFTGIESNNRIKWITTKWKLYFFNSNSQLHFYQLLRDTILVINGNKQLLYAPENEIILAED